MAGSGTVDMARPSSCIDGLTKSSSCDDARMNDPAPSGAEPLMSTRTGCAASVLTPVRAALVTARRMMTDLTN